jgi:hypothetical protein
VQYTIKGAFEVWADHLPSEGYQLLCGEEDIYKLALAAFMAGHDRGAVHELRNISEGYREEMEDVY